MQEISSDGSLQVRRIRGRAEAAAAIAFFLADGQFPTPLTPGERDLVAADPYVSLGNSTSVYWIAVDATGQIQAGLGIREQPHRTGIYELTAGAVAPAWRRHGVGRQLIQGALNHLEGVGARGLLVDTSDHEAYAGMRRLLTKCGFARVGHLPDFYFPGEGTVLYYRLFDRRGASS